jgi:hypothetical protein
MLHQFQLLHSILLRYEKLVRRTPLAKDCRGLFKYNIRTFTSRDCRKSQKLLAKTVGSLRHLTRLNILARIQRKMNKNARVMYPPYSKDFTFSVLPDNIHDAMHYKYFKIICYGKPHTCSSYDFLKRKKPNTFLIHFK